MIIDKKFSIVIYAGLNPLNLIQKDAAISADPVKSNEWEKLMQAVDSIYSTQQNDDSIPIFWTSRFPVIDQFGNTLYRYAPNQQSSLKKLDSKVAYYVILRDASLAPVKIPSNGPLVLGFSDVDSLPYVSPNLEDVILDQSNFRYTIKPTIVDLRPFETYNYSWKVVSSNWPVAINVASGELKPATPTGYISNTIAFCSTTGDCSDIMLDYTLPSQCSLENLDDPYVTLQLSIQSSSFDQAESLSDPFTITCQDCLPKPRISVSGQSLNIVESDDENAPIPSFDFQLRFNNLETSQEYSYIIETLSSEWPIYFYTPISGSFEALSPSHRNIDGKLYFCPTTGLCPPNGSTIPNYTIPSHPKFLSDEIDYSVTLRAALVSSSVLCDQVTHYSDPITIKYKKS